MLMLESARLLTDQILSPTFVLSAVARTTGVGIALLSPTRPAFTKNGSKTPPLSHVSIYPSSPLLRVVAASHGILTVSLWANVGSRVFRNGSGKSATTVILWDRVPAFWGVGIGSVYDSGRYITLAGHGTEAREITNEAKTDSVQCAIDADCKVVCPECDCKCKAHVCDCT
ncbi:hypothetical protein WN943_007471 [Citrus x changshan-huyou]